MPPALAPPVSYGGTLTITAGNPAPPGVVVRGTIRVTVTQAQSNSPPEGRLFLAVQEVIRQVATNANLAGSVAALVAIVPSIHAAGAALSFGIGDTAREVIAGFNLPGAMRTATDNAASAVYAATSPVIAQTTTTAAIAAGVPAAIAAAAGAAAGTRRGLGVNNSVYDSVREALIAAGRPAANAAIEALTAANAVTAASPALGQFTVRVYIRAAAQYRTYTHL